MQINLIFDIIMCKDELNSIEKINFKIQQYCSLQDRCQSDVEKKLTNWGLLETQIKEIVKHLKKNNYINEQRFCDSYTAGKFKIKKWGKVKIQFHLKLKGISSHYIRNSFRLLLMDDYIKSIQYLLKKKLPLVKSNDNYEKNAKAAKYLIGKGYEPHLVWEEIQKIN